MTGDMTREGHLHPTLHGSTHNIAHTRTHRDGTVFPLAPCLSVHSILLYQGELESLSNTHSHRLQHSINMRFTWSQHNCLFPVRRRPLLWRWLWLIIVAAFCSRKFPPALGSAIGSEMGLGLGLGLGSGVNPNLLNLGASLLPAQFSGPLNTAMKLQQGAKNQKANLQALGDTERMKALVVKFEDESRKIQKVLERLDEETYESREREKAEEQAEIDSLARNIAALAKLFRVYHDFHFPEKKGKTIYILPTTERDFRVASGGRRYLEFSREYLAGARNQCATLSNLVDRLRRAEPADDSAVEFTKLAETISMLPPEERLAEDILQESYYLRKISKLERLKSELLGAKR